MRSENVPLSPFIGIDGDVFLVTRRIRNSLPLDAGRKSSSTSTAQPGLFDGIDGRCGSDFKHFLECLESLVGAIIVHRQRVDQTTAPECPAILLDQVGNLVGRAESPIVFTACKKASREQVGYVVGLDVPVGDALTGDLDFNEWLEPGRTPGPVTYYLDAVARLFGLACDRKRDIIRAN